MRVDFDIQSTCFLVLVVHVLLAYCIVFCLSFVSIRLMFVVWWIVIINHWGYVQFSSAPGDHCCVPGSHCEGEGTILRVQRMRKWEVTLSER